MGAGRPRSQEAKIHLGGKNWTWALTRSASLRSVGLGPLFTRMVSTSGLLYFLTSPPKPTIAQAACRQLIKVRYQPKLIWVDQPYFESSVLIIGLACNRCLRIWSVSAQNLNTDPDSGGLVNAALSRVADPDLFCRIRKIFSGSGSYLLWLCKVL